MSREARDIAPAFRFLPADMALSYPRVLAPGVRQVIGDHPLTEVGDDDGVAVLRPEGERRAIAVLHQRPPDTQAVLAEADRLNWLDGRGAAPAVIATGRADEGDESVVIRLDPSAGNAASGHPLGPEQLVSTLAGAIRELHDLDAAQCPFDASFERLRGQVARKLEQGRIEQSETGPYEGRSPEQLIEWLDASFETVLASSEGHRPVVIHGGLRTDRVWFDPAGGVTFTGWRDGGLGDRHHDLAAAAAIVQELHGPALVAPLLDSYGLDDVDLRLLDAHQLLVHLLR